VTWLWRLLLHAFGAEFRRRHGTEVLAAIAAERQEPRYRGLAGAMRHVSRVTVDLIASAIRQRRARKPKPLSPFRSRKMDTFRQDLRYACRQLVRRPGFAAVAILSLALGIGGNTAVFGIVDSFVLHPFAFPDADRLVVIGPVFPKLSTDTQFIEVLSPLEYEDIHLARSFASTAAFDLGNRNISGGDVPDRVFTAFMLDDAFPVIGLRPFLGRGFTADELRPKGPPAAVISHRLWVSRFHSDRSLVGRTIRVNGVAATLVGVMPPQLLLIGTDLWIPWGARPDQAPRDMRSFSVIARLASGGSIRAAETELATIATRIASDHAAQFPEYTGWRLVTRPLASGVLQSVRPAGFLVLGAVSLVLFIACANLASLMLARATGRQREFAVRVALGAGRRRLAQQLLTEIAVLAVAGGAAGLALAAVAIRASNALLPPQVTAFGLNAAVNTRVAGWCVLSTTTAILLVGLLPVFQTGRADPNESLKHDARLTTVGRGARRARHGLVVAEIALAMMLALGAGLLLRSFLNLQRVNTGVDSASVITMRLTLPQEKYRTGEAITAFFEELTRRVEALPNVGRVGLTSQFPPQTFFRTRVLVDGAPAPGGSTFPMTQTTVASRGYFDALGIRLRAGRAFDDRDRAGTPRVAVVNDTFASRYLQGRPAVGARIRMGDKPEQSQPAEVVGVVASTTNVGAASAPLPEVFLSMEQGRDPWNQLFLVAKIAGDPMSAVPALRQAVVSIDPDQPVYAIQTLEQAFETSILPQQISTLLLTIFAAVALALAGIGIYGVTSYAVRSRTQEIGIRMAMGAERRSVMWMVLRQVLTLVVAGLTIGVGGVLALGPVLSAVLFGVSAVDPLTVASTATVLGVVALGAAWWPASVASRVDPVVALRYE
jgi:putative ABC transport system permease protein